MEIYLLAPAVLLYILICILISRLWLGWPLRLGWAFSVVWPMVIATWFINKVLKKKIIIDGVEISFD